MALLPACSLFAFTTIVSLPLASLKPFAKLIWFTPPLERHKLVMMKFSFKNKVGNDSESRLEITLFHKNITRIANAVQVTICLLVSTSVY